LHEAVKLGVVKLVELIKRIDGHLIDDPNAFIDGVFDAVFRHPATAAGIENTESKDEAESET
jgi:hypothetical protein